MDYLTRQALALLREDADYLADAREGAAVGNSIVGSVLSLTHGSPRWATERAVLAALTVIDDEAAPGNE
jgi:hypothetical protein